MPMWTSYQVQVLLENWSLKCSAGCGVMEHIAQVPFCKHAACVITVHNKFDYMCAYRYSIDLRGTRSSPASVLLVCQSKINLKSHKKI